MRKKMEARPCLAVVDMAVERKSPAGSCVLAEVRGLAKSFDITVFSDSCDAASESGVTWVRVALPTKPTLIRYLAFHLMVPLRMALWRLKGGNAAWVQTTQGQLPGADLVYAHFCHAAYLKGAWRSSTVTGLRRWARWLNHVWNAWYEGRAMRVAQLVVVPSLGLQRELTAEYPEVAARIVRIANPVDIARFARPPEFDRGAARHDLGLDDVELVLSFMALGDFARKGLGLLIEALGGLAEADRRTLKFVVIGGQPSEISFFKAEAARHGVAERLLFVGMQSDVRPYLWLSDAFAFPSAYEIFSLAILQAAAAGLPVLVSARLYGAEEFVEDGENGWVVERDVGGVRGGLLRMLADRHRMSKMASASASAVMQYSQGAFEERWHALYSGPLASAAGRVAACATIERASK